jgi:hypothetical protein
VELIDFDPEGLNLRFNELVLEERRRLNVGNRRHEYVAWPEVYLSKWGSDLLRWYIGLPSADDPCAAVPLPPRQLLKINGQLAEFDDEASACAFASAMNAGLSRSLLSGQRPFTKRVEDALRREAGG